MICFSGVQNSRVICVVHSSLAVVTDENCNPITKPRPQTVVCNTGTCPARWVGTSFVVEPSGQSCVIKFHLISFQLLHLWQDLRFIRIAVRSKDCWLVLTSCDPPMMRSHFVICLRPLYCSSCWCESQFSFYYASVAKRLSAGLSDERSLVRSSDETDGFSFGKELHRHCYLTEWNEQSPPTLHPNVRPRHWWPSSLSGVGTSIWEPRRCRKLLLWLLYCYRWFMTTIHLWWSVGDGLK